MKRLALRAVAIAGVLVLLVAAPAVAHERKKVGKVTVEVGFGTEPAYVGELNSVQLVVSQGGKPVTDVKGMKVQVTAASAEDQKLDLELASYFERGGIQGDYRAFFVPTALGRYTFHFTGAIKGRRFDRSFTSGKDGFDEVVDPAAVQFPAKQPTVGQLTEQLDRAVPRLTSALAASQAAARQARDDARQARGSSRSPASRSGCSAWSPVGSQRGESEPERGDAAPRSREVDSDSFKSP